MTETVLVTENNTTENENLNTMLMTTQFSSIYTCSCLAVWVVQGSSETVFRNGTNLWHDIDNTTGGRGTMATETPHTKEGCTHNPNLSNYYARSFQAHQIVLDDWITRYQLVTATTQNVYVSCPCSTEMPQSWLIIRVVQGRNQDRKDRSHIRAVTQRMTIQKTGNIYQPNPAALCFWWRKHHDHQEM